MFSFWLKPRQIVMMDAESARPARNLKVRFITLMCVFLMLIGAPFLLGSWYAPFHSTQEIIPENMKLKRQNIEMNRKVADSITVNNLKDEQLNSLKEQLSLQENEIVNVNKQLLMYKSILDERKGTGIHVLESTAVWDAEKTVEWKSLFVKGGSYPRFLLGHYAIFALDDEGRRVTLGESKMKYRIESHIFLQRKFDWHETWLPKRLELIVYDSRSKEVLRKIVPIQGNE